MKQYHSRLFFAASMAFCIAFTAPSAWASKAWYAEGVIRTDFRDTRISTTGCQGAALDESAGKVFFGTAPDATAAAGIAQYSLLSLTRTEGIVEPDHVAQGVDAYGAMWGRSFGVAKGFVFSCSRNQTEKGKIEVRPYATYSASESTLVSLAGDLDGIADLVLYPVTVNADGTSFYGCDASRLLKFTIGWNKDGSVASLTYAGSCALDRPNAITVAAVGGRELVYAIAENDNKTASDLTILDVTDGAAMSETSTTTVSETGDAFGIAVSGIAAGLPHLTVAGAPKMKVLSLTTDGTGVDVTTPVATFTTADFFPDAGVGIANRFGLAVTDDETRMFLSVSASQHLMVSAVMPPDWTIYVKATSAKDPVIPTVPYDSEATAAPDLNTAIAYANKLGLRKVKVVGTVNITTKVAFADVEVFADGWDAAAVCVAANLAPASTIGANVFIHDIKFTHASSASTQRALFSMTGADSVISNCWISGMATKTSYVDEEIAGHAEAGLITHCKFTGNHSNNGGESSSSSSCYGAGLLGLSGTARMVNSVFAVNDIGGNSRGPMDGTLSISESAVLENCVVYGNKVAAVNTTDGDGTSRRRPRRGAGVFVVSGSPVIRNCIIRNNLKPRDWVEDPASVDILSPVLEGDINIRAGATPIIENCNVPEGQVPEGAVDCQTDLPGFTDAAGGDFSIAADSPCVDAGKYGEWQLDETDYSGVTPRYQGMDVDIGAYEVANAITPQTVSILVGGETAGEKYATATFEIVRKGPRFTDATSFFWYVSDPSVGSPEPFATGAVVTNRFTEGAWTVYLKIVNSDGKGTQISAVSEDAVVVTHGADYYVSAKGDDDEGSGDIDAPFSTLEHALEGMSAGQSVKIVGAVNVNTVLTLEGVEVYGYGPELSTLNLPAVTGNEMNIGDNAILHGLTLTDQFQTSHGSRFNMTGEGAVVSNCYVTGFNGNTANGPAGGYASAGTITHCLFYSVRPGNGGGGQSADHRGYGIVELTGTARMINSIMTNCGPDSNVRGPLDGVLAMSGNAVLENCVIYGNRSKATASGDAQDEKSYHQKPRRGGGIFVKSGSPVIRDCIIRNNKKAHEPSDGKYPTETGEDIYAATEESDFQILAGATPKISFCNIPEGQVPECATNCQTGDPKFAKPDVTPAETRDFSIAEDSPCVDAGNGKGWRKGATDYAGNPRIQGRRVDIGAYEYNSGVVDWGFQVLVR